MQDLDGRREDAVGGKALDRSCETRLCEGRVGWGAAIRQLVQVPPPMGYGGDHGGGGRLRGGVGAAGRRRTRRCTRILLSRVWVWVDHRVLRLFRDFHCLLWMEKERGVECVTHAEAQSRCSSRAAATAFGCILSRIRSRWRMPCASARAECHTRNSARPVFYLHEGSR